MSTTNIRHGIHIPFIKIRYLQCTETVPGIIIAVAGLLTSLWSNCILAVVCTQDNYNIRNEYIEQLIIQTGQLSHLIIALSSTIGLISGLKERHRPKIAPWLGVKVIELIIIFVGCILLGTGRKYTGLMPVGIIFLLFGGYIFMCILDTYQKIDDNPTPPENISVNIPDDFTIQDKPPTYDSFTNQQNIHS